MATLKKTPLNRLHHDLKAKMMDFAGWELPVWYTSIVEEHHTCRNDKAMWEVSHMGRVWVTGREAEPFLDKVLTKSVHSLEVGEAQLCLMCLENGGILDDLWVYRLGSVRFFIVWNAAEHEKKLAWLRCWVGADPNIVINDVSAQTAMLAVQGPNVPKLKVLQHVTDLCRFASKETKIGDIDALVARTGYTGEDGFEIIVNKDQALRLWQTFIDEGVRPCGLGCRDSLRMEAGMLLSGQDFDANTNPLEAGLEWLISYDDHDFIGKEAILKAKQGGIKRKLVGFRMSGREIARSGYKVVKNGREVGVVTSGGPSPTLGVNIGFAYVPIELAKAGTEIGIIIRNKPVKATVTKRKFYKRGG